VRVYLKVKVSTPELSRWIAKYNHTRTNCITHWTEDCRAGRCCWCQCAKHCPFASEDGRTVRQLFYPPSLSLSSSPSLTEQETSGHNTTWRARGRAQGETTFWSTKSQTERQQINVRSLLLEAQEKRNKSRTILPSCFSFSHDLRFTLALSGMDAGQIHWHSHSRIRWDPIMMPISIVLYSFTSTQSQSLARIETFNTLHWMNGNKRFKR